MKKIFILLLCSGLLVSCASSYRTIIPRAVNTVNTAPLADLNLARGDYEVLNTVSAEASIIYTTNAKGTKIEMGDGGEFSLVYISMGRSGWICDYRGIAQFGYLHADYADAQIPGPGTVIRPEDLARRLAIYRLINEVEQYGGDAIIEPTIATNVEQLSKRSIVYKTRVTAKIIKIKTDR